MRRLTLIFFLLTGCGANEGSFTLLTYNVAGLPGGLSKSDPEKNHPLIGPLLNAYDLVLVQEDFGFHAQLSAEIEHPHRSVPKTAERLVNDGLNRFSRLPMDLVERHTWLDCNGALDASSDCLADKGMSVATTYLDGERGAAVEVVNFHFDAGGSAEDGAARAVQVGQLLEVMEARSAGGPVIVAGDTNLRPEREGGQDQVLLDRLLEEGQLTDACRALACGDEGRIDRVFLRSGDELELEPLSWRLAEEFVDAEGQPLSDHEAVAVEIAWRR